MTDPIHPLRGVSGADLFEFAMSLMKQLPDLKWEGHGTHSNGVYYVGAQNPKKHKHDDNVGWRIIIKSEGAPEQRNYSGCHFINLYVEHDDKRVERSTHEPPRSWWQRLFGRTVEPSFEYKAGCLILEEIRDWFRKTQMARDHESYAQDSDNFTSMNCTLAGDVQLGEAFPRVEGVKL